jgi:2-amino-4-hydroxy-6-hydroxymethyldihydropteridine diphosphokinase
MHERRFVLEPLCDVAANWIHPALGQSAASLRNSLAAANSQRIALWSD